jgi:hypothetical protein
MMDLHRKYDKHYSRSESSEKGSFVMRNASIRSFAKPLFQLILVALMTVVASNAFAEELSTIQKEVWKMEELYFELCKKADSKGLMEIFHKDSVIWGNASSRPKGRTNFDMGATGEIIHGIVESFQLQPHKITVLGSTCISAFTARLQWLDKAYRLRIVHTWIKQDGKWLMIGAMHDSCTKLPTCP